MRVRNGARDQVFLAWISSLPYDAALNVAVTIPDYISQPANLEGLLNSIYPSDILQSAVGNWETFRTRTILSVLNTTVTALNKTILARFSGEGRLYSSVDSCNVNGESKELDEIPVEILQDIDLPSLPPSSLHLKLGCPVILLRKFYACKRAYATVPVWWLQAYDGTV